MVLSWPRSIILRGKSAALYQLIRVDLSESDTGCATGRMMHAYGGTADWVAEGVGDLCGARLHLAALQVVRVILLLFLLGSSLSLCSGRLLLHRIDGEGRL